MSCSRHASLLLSLAAVAAGCGPSLRALHEGARYFERCHAAELLPSVPPERKLACWERWLAHYAENQPPERVTYARLRQVAIAQGEELAPLHALESQSGKFTTTLPLTAETALPAPPPLHGPCAEPCSKAWRRCAARCPPGAETCLRTCRDDATRCDRACP